MNNLEQIKPYLIPPIAASTAIIPVFYGYIAKSSLQLGNPIPKMTITNIVKQSFRASPNIGGIVGTQIVAHQFLEHTFLKIDGKDHKPGPGFTLITSLSVGAISIYPLAIFNGLTIGHSFKKSIYSMSLKQSAAILTRETSFLFSLSISDRVSNELESKFPIPRIHHVSNFVSGAFGSMLGHPADTALTLWQKGFKVISVQQLFRGFYVKAGASGGFVLLFKGIQRTLFEKSSS